MITETLPLVSIVIPCYNAEAYVGEAIQSALDQTYPQSEVIIIDDGSTDGSLEVIKSFGDAVRWESGPNRGACAARNRGIELARGELIQFLDADDLLYPRKLERQVPLACEQRPALVYCDYHVEPAGDEPMQAVSRECRGLDAVVFVLQLIGLQTSAPLHWRDVLIRIGGFRVDLRASQERNLHLRLAVSGIQLCHLAECLYCVRKRHGSVSSNPVRSIGERLKYFPQTAAELERCGQLSQVRRHEFAVTLAQDGRRCFALGATALGRACLEEARKIAGDRILDVLIYSSPTRRLSMWLLGPVITEYLIQMKRQLLGRLSRRPKQTTCTLQVFDRSGPSELARQQHDRA